MKWLIIRGNRRAMRLRKNVESTSTNKELTRSAAFLQNNPKVTDCIGQLLKKYQIKPIYKPTEKLQQNLRSIEDDRDPKTTCGIYWIPCNCGDMYIGTIKRSMNTRINEHRRHCCFGEIEKSSVAEHVLINRNHEILF